ncbi:helix-turn-helix transcriptional regulator [Kribbella sandramycini]|uniref:DNA-binding CsgD family transcriptional regulator n=1 Tax=Kribbella sandramycini TaxID=60450 RepID=A0A7Y4L4S3_9ACTN|nr:DNA-binding CsgD family transcriptional regulator [Kribbella sandramycini]NOL44394.1 helix-turn-helix transcriptional regulator [Kribbella sandramycini]
MNHAAQFRAYDRVVSLTDAKLPLAELFDEAQQVLRRAISRDSSCWHAMDPATLIETRYSAERMPAPTAQIAEIAYLYDDFNSFGTLFKAPRHSGVLSEATGGDLRKSRRYRELLEPVGMTGELRTAFVVDGVAWGCVSFFRQGDFTPEERDFANVIAPLLGLCFRSAGIHARSGGPGANLWPGVLVFDERRQLESHTPSTAGWLAELGFEGSITRDRLPYKVVSIVERVRITGREATARMLGESGRWIQIHAAPASTGDTWDHRVAVVLQTAAVPSVAPLVSAAYGLTPRERELTELVLQGNDTREIAGRLHLSPHTVQSHLKSIFAKVGVRSRRELVGRIAQGR